MPDINDYHAFKSTSNKSGSSGGTGGSGNGCATIIGIIVLWLLINKLCDLLL